MHDDARQGRVEYRRMDDSFSPRPSLRLPCACGAVVEADSGAALLAAVEAHIAKAHGNVVAHLPDERPAADTEAALKEPLEKGR